MFWVRFPNQCCNRPSHLPLTYTVTIGYKLGFAFRSGIPGGVPPLTHAGPKALGNAQGEPVPRRAGSTERVSHVPVNPTRSVRYTRHLTSPRTNEVNSKGSRLEKRAPSPWALPGAVLVPAFQADQISYCNLAEGGTREPLGSPGCQGVRRHGGASSGSPGEESIPATLYAMLEALQHHNRI